MSYRMGVLAGALVLVCSCAKEQKTAEASSETGRADDGEDRGSRSPADG